MDVKQRGRTVGCILGCSETRHEPLLHSERLRTAAPGDGKMLGIALHPAAAPASRRSSHPPSVLASSTKMISFSRRAGEACRTLYTVRSSVDQASLWKMMMTLVVGRGGHRLNLWSMHLRERKAVV